MSEETKRQTTDILVVVLVAALLFSNVAMFMLLNAVNDRLSYAEEKLEGVSTGHDILLQALNDRVNVIEIKLQNYSAPSEGWYGFYGDGVLMYAFPNGTMIFHILNWTWTQTSDGNATKNTYPLIASPYPNSTFIGYLYSNGTIMIYPYNQTGAGR